MGLRNVVHALSRKCHRRGGDWWKKMEEERESVCVRVCVRVSVSVCVWGLLGEWQYPAEDDNEDKMQRSGGGTSAGGHGYSRAPSPPPPPQ